MALQRMHLAETALTSNRKVEQMEKQLADMRQRHGTLQENHEAMLASHAEALHDPVALLVALNL